MATRRGWAACWAVLVLTMVVHQLQFWRATRLDTDVMALLPMEQQSPALAAATRQLAEYGQQQVVVMVGSSDWGHTRDLATRVDQALRRQPLLQAAPTAPDPLAGLTRLYQPWRDRLLTPQQRDWLRNSSSESLAEQALLQLYQPGVSGPAGNWQADPLNLWQGWLSTRAAESPARPRDGLLWLAREGRQWALLNYHYQGGAFSVGTDQPINTALNQLRQSEPDAAILAAGVPLHAEAAAARASLEINTIGWGSMLAVLLLVRITFRSLVPIWLVGLSLLIGCGAALSVTSLLFERVHVLTLVFGASLVGVAEDYGFHYFAARQGLPAEQRWQVLRRLLPGLLLAFVTSAIAYLALGLAPFPGLRQMAVFSVAGLLAAFLTVVCWFPWLDRRPLPPTRFARHAAASLLHWPRWRANRTGIALGLALLALVGTGLVRLESRDDLRQLHGSPARLVEDQIALSRLLNLPSPAQFYLVEGDSPAQVLAREEALSPRLEQLLATHQLNAYRALSNWIPSPAQQADNAHLTERAERAVLQRLAEQTGEALQRPSFAPEPIGLDGLQQASLSQLLGPLWLGQIDGRYYSMVLVAPAPSAGSQLAAAGDDLAGVRWVDKTRDYSSLLGSYRRQIGGLLLAGYACVLLTLCWRYGRQGWRALLPTALGSLITLALFGLAGEPLQLFSMLALLLLLGMGVDFGIFLLEHPGDGMAWLAVALAGLSTLLSFGLLAFSSTPALHSFGLTMLIGELATMLLSPCFRLQAQEGAACHAT